MEPQLIRASQLRSLERWRRMMVRLETRRRWHWQGLMLWLIQRPHIRHLPFPLPMVSKVEEWKQQLMDAVKRKTWPRSWLQKAANKMTAVHLRDGQTLRARVGMEMAFLEDEVIMIGLKMLKMKPRSKQQGALIAKTHQALRELDGFREDHVRNLLGPALQCGDQGHRHERPDQREDRTNGGPGHEQEEGIFSSISDVTEALYIWVDPCTRDPASRIQ